MSDYREPEWYYVRQGYAKGPIHLSTLQEMYRAGSIGPSDQVWAPHLEGWRRADTTPELGNTVGKKPTDIFAGEYAAPFESSETVGLSPSPPRPWVRLFARTMDYFGFVIVAAFLLALIAPDQFLLIMEDDGGSSLFALGGILLWHFIEGWTISSFGTTPGKKLYGTSVVRKDGTRLTYEGALNRAFKVWFKGVGLGLPLIGMITQIVAYFDLKKQGRSSWDRDKDLVVLHESISTLRIVGISFFWLLWFVLIAIGGGS